MTSSVETYLEARAQFERCNQKIDEFSTIAATVSSILKSGRGTFSFANTSTGLPMEATMSGKSKSVDANQWPNAEQIQKALADWHSAKNEMSSAWSTIPAHHRSGLQPPP
jgi:hypothetical protein